MSPCIDWQQTGEMITLGTANIENCGERERERANCDYIENSSYILDKIPYTIAIRAL